MIKSSELLIARALIATGNERAVRLAQEGAITACEALEMAAPQWFTDEWKQRMPPTWSIHDHAEFAAHAILVAAHEAG